MQVFARKVLDFQRSQSSQFPDELRTVEKLCKEGNENIIEVLQADYLQDSGHRVPFIDMELCDFNLKQFNDNHWKVLNAYYPQAWNIMAQIASGLVFIHAKKYVHRDLKPENGTIPELTRPDLCGSFRREGSKVENLRF